MILSICWYQIVGSLMGSILRRLKKKTISGPKMGKLYLNEFEILWLSLDSIILS